MFKHRTLMVIVLVQTALIIGLLFGESRQSAMAQIPDQGAQLQRIVDETKLVNTKLDRLIGLLEGGKLKVRVQQAEEK